MELMRCEFFRCVSPLQRSPFAQTVLTQIHVLRPATLIAQSLVVMIRAVSLIMMRAANAATIVATLPAPTINTLSRLAVRELARLLLAGRRKMSWRNIFSRLEYDIKNQSLDAFCGNVGRDTREINQRTCALGTRPRIHVRESFGVHVKSVA
jgi:hypothetical protein